MKNEDWIIGIIALGGLYFLTKKNEQQNAPLMLLPPANRNTGNGIIKPTPSTKPTTVATPKKSDNTNTLANRWVFVDSINGETIYAGVNATNNVFSGYGKDKIMMLGNNVELGVATGTILNGMIEVRVTISGKGYKFFVDSTQVRIMDDAQRNFYINTAKTGRRKTTQELDKIVDFFRTK